MSEAEPAVTQDHLDETPPPPEPRTRSVRRPGRPKGSTSRKPASTRRRTPSKPPTPSASETVRGIFQIPATGFVMVGQRAGSVPLVADGATILVHGATLADAIGEWAEHDPRVMAGIEKLVMFGPASAVVMALVIMGAQFTRNHREDMAPILEGFGAVPPEQIIAAAQLPIPVAPSENGQRQNVTPPEN
jgi:hypothetical protein